jgi:ADP-ribose pyrophosphatase YjhB (NUDIX family)
MNNLIVKLGKIGNPKICTSMAIIKENQLLIGLRHYTPDKWKSISVWTTPGGRCDDGETLETSLRREVAEEVGITELDVNDFLGIVPGAKEDDLLYVFIGKTSQEPRLLEPEKFSEWKWEDVNSIPENFINPKALELIKDYLNS